MPEWGDRLISPFNVRAPGEGNPFDDSTESGAWSIHALVGPRWLNSASDEDLELIAIIADFEFVELLVVADGPASKRRAADVGLNVGWIEVSDDVVALRTDRSVSLAGSINTLQHLRKQTANEDTALEQLLGLSSLRYDYLIGSAQPPWAPPADRGPDFVSLSGFMEDLRLLCVAHRHFAVRPRFKVNEGFYFLYRRDIQFPVFRKAWLYAHRYHGRRLEGLWKRLEFICRACDAASIQASRTANNDVEDSFLFHLAFEYFLATGAFDDLAALASAVYDLGLHRMDTTLRRRQGKFPVREALRDKNHRLFSFLSDPSIEKLIESFYPLRDAFQHGEFPFTVGRMSSGRRRLPSSVVVPRTGVEMLISGLGGPAGASAETWPDSPNDVMVDLAWLVDSATAAAGIIVNGFLDSIDWRQMSTNPDGSNPSDALWAKFVDSPAKFLNWMADPILFGELPSRWRQATV